MATYVWCNETNHWVDKKTREPMHIPDRGDEVHAPMVMKDVPEYRSPIDGKLITSRSHRREDLKKNGCVEWTGPSTKGYGNPEYCKKHGLPLSEEAMNRKRPKYLDPLADLKK